MSQHYTSRWARENAHVPEPESLVDHCGIWIYGKTGTGKTELAHEMLKQSKAGRGVTYYKYCDQWWDGWNDQQYAGALIDNVDGKSEWTKLKKFICTWADKKAFKGHIRHAGQRWVRPKMVIVISYYTIEELCGRDSELAARVKRRFPQVIHRKYDVTLADETTRLLAEAAELKRAEKKHLEEVSKRKDLAKQKREAALLRLAATEKAKATPTPPVPEALVAQKVQLWEEKALAEKPSQREPEVVDLEAPKAEKLESWFARLQEGNKQLPTDAELESTQKVLNVFASFNASMEKHRNEFWAKKRTEMESLHKQ